MRFAARSSDDDLDAIRFDVDQDPGPA